MEKLYCVYILTNRRNGTLYTGVSGDLVARVYQHKTKTAAGFTKEHDLRYLVWYEAHSTPDAAITREKQIKKWNRAWKIRLIEEFNPVWRDLFEEIAQ